MFFSRLLRDDRGSAALELGIGAVVVLIVAALALDLYSHTRANAASGRIASTMADYASRETAPDGDQISALGAFLLERELDAPAALVFVISAVHRQPGTNPAVLLWDDDTVRLGDAAATGELLQECRSRGQAGWRQSLLSAGPNRLPLPANDVVIVVEVCAKLLRQGLLTSRLVAGNIYRLHALPVRDRQQLPSAPVYATAVPGLPTMTGVA